MANKKGVWRTVAGRRIFIEDGQDLSTAMAKSGKFKVSKKQDKIDAKKMSKLSLEDKKKFLNEKAAGKNADKERMKEFAKEDDDKALDREAERQTLEAEMRAKDSEQSKLDKVGVKNMSDDEFEKATSFTKKDIKEYLNTGASIDDTTERVLENTHNVSKDDQERIKTYINKLDKVGINKNKDSRYEHDVELMRVSDDMDKNGFAITTNKEIAKEYFRSKNPYVRFIVKDFNGKYRITKVNKK